MMTVDPLEKGAQHKREQIAKLISLTEEQRTIIDLYILEEKTKKRHWELDPDDPNIYLEWMNGTDILRNKINNRLNMTREQKRIAMNNNSQQQQIANKNGNNIRRQQQQPPQPVPTPQQAPPTTTSGKEYKITERPDLAQAETNKPPTKRYPRYSRS
jgi:hypothetical protein